MRMLFSGAALVAVLAFALAPQAEASPLTTGLDAATPPVTPHLAKTPLQGLQADLYVGVGYRGYYRPYRRRYCRRRAAPAVVYSSPRYVAPAPVYSPPVTYYEPAPVYVAPAPVVYSRPYYRYSYRYSRPVVRPVLRFVTARRLKERVESLPLLATPRSLVFAVEFLAPRIVNGVGVALIAISIFDSPARDWFTIGAAYAVAGAIGILAVFVPGGLGVREGAFVGILTAAGFNIIDAIVLAVAARFVSTVADLLVAGVYGLLTVNLRRKKGTGT